MCEATPKNYLTHAKTINAIAGEILQIKTKDASPVSAKVSLGLSLQAAELAGKGMLRSSGCTVDEIRKEYKNHDLLSLLKDVEIKLQNHPDEQLSKFHHFLLWTPVIDGTEFDTTIAAYFNEHFSKGRSAYPRNYFYPDEQVFTGPAPIHAVYVMVEHIVDVAEIIIELLNNE